MSTRLRSDPALTAAVERAREVAEVTGELRASSASSPAASLSPEARRILAGWIGDGGYTLAVAEVAVFDPDLADQ